MFTEWHKNFLKTRNETKNFLKITQKRRIIRKLIQNLINKNNLHIILKALAVKNLQQNFLKAF